jgi:hypothetical protein
MFVQIIQGATKDAAGMLRRAEEWDANLKPGAEGFLGSTSGVSDNGEFIAVARFESEDAARRNSDRPEQGKWWAETAKLIEGEARFYDTTDVELFLSGGSDDAGFVQIIQGTASDRARLEEAMQGDESEMSAARPDVIGGLVAWQGNDFTNVVYFTSEDEARKGEQSDAPDEQEWDKLMDNVKFIDLRNPYFSTP